MKYNEVNVVLLVYKAKQKKDQQLKNARINGGTDKLLT